MFVSEGERVLSIRPWKNRTSEEEEEEKQEEEEGKSVSSEGGYDAYYGFKERMKDCGKSDGGVEKAGCVCVWGGEVER